MTPTARTSYAGEKFGQRDVEISADGIERADRNIDLCGFDARHMNLSIHIHNLLRDTLCLAQLLYSHGYPDEQFLITRLFHFTKG